jgi:hypothetical protein
MMFYGLDGEPIDGAAGALPAQQTTSWAVGQNRRCDPRHTSSRMRPAVALVSVKTTSFEAFLLDIIDRLTRAQPLPAPGDLCECDHYRGEHRRRGEGRCRALDSYGIPCACPSVEPVARDLFDPDGDPDGDRFRR